MSHLYGFKLEKGGVLKNLFLVTLCSPLEGEIQATYIVWYYHREALSGKSQHIFMYEVFITV